MTGVDWIVVLGAAAAIAWVNWYFFLAGHSRTAAVAATSAASGAGAGRAEAVILVDGGYSPNAVRVRAGEPVRLVFDRRDASSCSEEVVLPAFGIRKYLPTGQRTSVEITPPAPGRYEFMCGMSMLRGTLIAE